VAFTMVAFASCALVGAVVDGVLGSVFAVVVAVGMTTIPLAMLVAVTRYRLYDLDRVVSRTIAYLLTVAVLGLTYVGLVVTMRGLLPVQGDLPVAISTLAVAVAFLPVAQRVQAAVDRRFFRSRYDAAQVVSRLADDLRGSLDLREVVERAEEVVEEVLSPETVGVWLAEESS
jgi:hypothetical protein